MEKFLGIFPRIVRNSGIGRNFSMNMSENFLGIFPKLIPRNIHRTPIFLRKNSELYLYGNFTRKQRGMYSKFFPWNNSDIFLEWKKIMEKWNYGKLWKKLWKKIKFLRKDFDPCYLRLGNGESCIRDLCLIYRFGNKPQFC
jgi:hypothetical protein